MEIRRTIAANLRKYRLEAGLTQVQAAERMGMAQSYISRVENENQRPEDDTLERFAKVYNVPNPLKFFEPVEPELEVA